jgi:subtilisin family serine protease
MFGARTTPSQAFLRSAAPGLGLALLLAGPFLAVEPSVAQVPSRGKIAPSLARRISADPSDQVIVWVYFTDRAGAEHDPSAYEAARRSLSERSLARRAARGTFRDVVESDLPAHEPYVHALVARGAQLRGVSRWLNAASVAMPARLVNEIAPLPFVARVELVPVGRSIAPEPVIEASDETPAGAPSRRGTHGESASPNPVTALAPGDTAYYGGSFKQLSMMQVPQLHALGLSGAGVLVCMLDSGFHLAHRVYASLNIVAKRDFLHGDTNVDDEPGQDTPGQSSHGSLTLGCVAGWKPGQYEGGAYRASVALGKTENIATETPAEMDTWQFGAEWADSLGADVISSSLGYSVFDDTTLSYHYSDMNGRTTVVTRAAVEAVRRGITVVNSAGNSGADPWHFVIAPADADTLITSGAVDSFNVVTAFSSRGPTFDGRIKPDVTAMGRSVLLPSNTVDSTYVRASGTSFSAPLTSGLVALLLEAHPTWGPFEVREALRETALNHATPNNDIGWGLVQGLAARAWIPSTVGVGPRPQATIALSVGPNPLRVGSAMTIRFTLPSPSRATVEVLDVTGRRLARPFDGMVEGAQSVRFTGNASDGAPLAAGVYWIRLSVLGSAHSTQAARVVLLP